MTIGSNGKARNSSLESIYVPQRVPRQPVPRPYLERQPDRGVSKRLESSNPVAANRGKTLDSCNATSVTVRKEFEAINARPREFDGERFIVRKDQNITASARIYGNMPPSCA